MSLHISLYRSTSLYQIYRDTERYREIWSDIERDIVEIWRDIIERYRERYRERYGDIYRER